MMSAVSSIDNAGAAIEIVLVGMLSATILIAIRLERALGVLRRDRASLEKLVSGFNESTQKAEFGIERLQGVAEGTGRQIARHIDRAKSLQTDLEFLVTRADKAATRLEALVVGAKTPRYDSSATSNQLAPASSLSLVSKSALADTDTKPKSQAERDLMMVLRAVR